MGIDLTKLTPAPWEVEPFDPDFPSGAIYGPGAGRFAGVLGSDGDCTDAVFIALARNAFDVLIRRGGWSLQCVCWQGNARSYRVLDEHDEPVGEQANNPFTALVDADCWFAAHGKPHPAAGNE